uniref:Uncharacterized protein n=1 Tax=Rhizophora mucronata TaxID=61149 RepID=A0A2P2N2E0_RHIMU
MPIPSLSEFSTQKIKRNRMDTKKPW